MFNRCFEAGKAKFLVLGLGVALSLGAAVVQAADRVTPKQAQGATRQAQVQLNPDFFYFFGGNIIGSRGFSLGDPNKWGVPVTNLSGKSAGNKIEVSPTNYQGENDAIHAVWSRHKIKGELALYGPPINIEAHKNAAALTFDLNMKRKPNKEVKIGLDCSYPCRAEVSAGNLLRKYPANTWITFPVPLNCFDSKNFDLSKINGVFMISTEGRMEMSIANIRLERLPEGDKGCQ